MSSVNQLSSTNRVNNMKAKSSALKIALIYILLAILWKTIFQNAELHQLAIPHRNSDLLVDLSFELILIITTAFFLYYTIKRFYQSKDRELERLLKKENIIAQLQKSSKTGLWEYNIKNKEAIWCEVTRDIFEVDEHFKPYPGVIQQFFENNISKKDILKFYEEVQNHELDFDMETKIITAKGNEKYVRIIGSPIYNNDTVISINGMFIDITDIANKETHLTTTNRLYQSLVEINKVTSTEEDPNIIFQKTCDIAVNIGKLKSAWIGTIDEEKQLIVVNAQSGVIIDEHKQISTIQENFNPAVIAYKYQQHVVCNDIETQEFKEWNNRVIQLGFKSHISFPIKQFGETKAILKLYSDKKNYFDTAEINLLHEVVSNISVALEKIASVEMREISERKFKNIIETATEGIWTVDINRRLTFVNQRIADMHGYTRDEMIGMHLLAFIDPSVKEQFDQNTLQLPNGHKAKFQSQHIRKDKSKFWVEVSLTSLFEKGKYMGSLSMIQDITVDKEAQEKIKEALYQYETVLEATHDTVWDWDIQNNTIKFSIGWKRTFGYDHEYLYSIEEIRNILHPLDKAKLREHIYKNIQAQKQTYTSTFRLLSNDGKYKWVENNAIIRYSMNGIAIRGIGTIRDITEKVEMNFRIDRAISNAQERERQEMGMELHDNVNQILTVAAIYLEMQSEKSNIGSAMRTDLKLTESYIRSAIEEIRKLSHQLAPVAISSLPIENVFEKLLQTLTLKSNFDVILNIDIKNNDNIHEEMKISLYRILQEQIINIIKHAKASKVRVSLKEHDHTISLEVSDNGIGFDKSIKSSGIGFENINRRTRLLYGDVQTFSSVGKGCKLMITIPKNQEIKMH